MTVILCAECQMELTHYDMRLQQVLKGICLACGKAGDWTGLTPPDQLRCAELHRWANMTTEQRIAYDRLRGS